MPRNEDWLPKNHDALYQQSKQTRDYVRLNLEKIGITGINADWFNHVFEARYDNFENAYRLWQNKAERTPKIAAAFKDARALFVPVYRQLYTGFLKNNLYITDKDLVAMGVPRRSPAKLTPPPVPDTVPEATVKYPSPAVVLVHFRDKGSGKKAKPAGIHGVEIVWAILDEKPQTWSALTNHVFNTRTPCQFTFEGNLRGKKFYFALRWENTRGKKGNWSEIYEAVIP